MMACLYDIREGKSTYVTRGHVHDGQGNENGLGDTHRRVQAQPKANIVAGAKSSVTPPGDPDIYALVSKNKHHMIRTDAHRSIIKTPWRAI